MKHSVCTAAALFLLTVAQAQIKIADDTYKLPAASSPTASALEQPLDLEKEFPRYVAKIPNLNNEEKKILNPVGERFYLCETSKDRVVCTNPEQRTAQMTVPQVGYYEFVGVIFFSDDLDTCRVKVMQYTITADNSGDVEDYLSYLRKEEIKAAKMQREIFALRRKKAAIKTGVQAAEVAAQKAAVDKSLKRKERIENLENLEKQKQDLKDQLRAYDSEIIKLESSLHYGHHSDAAKALSAELKKKELGLNNNWYPDETILPIYIVRDEAGNEYYIRNGELQKMRYVMVSFFERVSKLSGSQCVIYMEDPSDFKVKDALSGEVVSFRPNSDQYETKVIQGKLKDELNYVDCKDVVLKDGRVVAVFQSNAGSFALPISYCGVSCFTEQPYDAVEYDFYETPGLSSLKRDRIYISTRQGIAAARTKYAAITLELKQKQAMAAEISRREHEAAMAKRRAELIAKYGEKYGPVIFERKVSIGMTPEMCREAWGFPSRRERTTTSRYVRETWFYGITTYLVFEDGKLVMIQN